MESPAVPYKSFATSSLEKLMSVPPLSEPTAHVDTFIRDNMPTPDLWPEMDYSVLPELAAYPARLNAAVEILDKQVANGFGASRCLI